MPTYCCAVGEARLEAGHGDHARFDDGMTAQRYPQAHGGCCVRTASPKPARSASARLAQGGDVAALNALLGMLRVPVGRAGARRSEHLRTPIEVQPERSDDCHNLVQALIELRSTRRGAIDVADATNLSTPISRGRLLRFRGFAGPDG